MRYGATADLAVLPDGLLEGDLTKLAYELNHCAITLAAGVKRRYIGDLSVDTWAARAHENHSDPFGVQISGTPYQFPTQLPTATVTKFV